MFTSGREALPDVREWSGSSPGCPEVGGRPSRMSGCCREDFLSCLGCPLRCPGLFGKPSRMSGRPTQISGSVREALSVIRVWLGVPRG